MMRDVDTIRKDIDANRSLQEQTSAELDRLRAEEKDSEEVKQARAILDKWNEQAIKLRERIEQHEHKGYELDAELYKRNLFDKVEAAKFKGLFDADSAYAFLSLINCKTKTPWGNNNEQWVRLCNPKSERGYDGSWKDSFYLKKTLSNGVQIFHDFQEYGYVRYFAFKDCALVGYYAVRRSEHAGDYSYSYAFINEKNYTENLADSKILVNEWIDKLEKLTTFVSADTKDNETAKMLCKN